MCTASARSARLSVRKPPTTSTAVYAAVRASANPRARALVVPEPWSWWSCPTRGVLPVWAYGRRRRRRIGAGVHRRRRAVRQHRRREEHGERDAALREQTPAHPRLLARLEPRPHERMVEAAPREKIGRAHV